MQARLTLESYQQILMVCVILVSRNTIPRHRAPWRGAPKYMLGF